jgi:hypothetical protein
MLADRASWVEPCVGNDDKTFDGYPDESLAEWHERLGLVGSACQVEGWASVSLGSTREIALRPVAEGG